MKSPRTLFVAGFIGSPKMNMIAATVTARDGATLTVTHPSLASPIQVTARRHAGGPGPQPGDGVTLGLRPEHLSLGDGENRIALSADLSESLGGSTLIHGQTQAAETIVLQTPGRRMLGKGDAFTAGFDAARVYVFDSDGQAV